MILVGLDIFGQVSDGLQRGQVQFLYNHVAVSTPLPNLVRCNVGSGHVSAGEDHSGPWTKTRNQCWRNQNVNSASEKKKTTKKTNEQTQSRPVDDKIRLY